MSKDMISFLVLQRTLFTLNYFIPLLLGKWTEMNIVRDRLYKGLAEATKKADV